MAEIKNNILSLPGDSIIVEIRPEVEGKIQFRTFTDTFLGFGLNIDDSNAPSTSKEISREFRILTNGIFTTDWKPLNDVNLQNTEFPDNSYIQVRYTRIGDDTEGDLEFVRIDLEGDYSVRVLEGTPTVDNSIFSDVASDKNTDLLTENLFKKLYFRGIVPQYITRAENLDLNEDRDYVVLFYTIAQFFAIIFRFFKRFENFENDFELMLEWIRQKGIYFDESTVTLDELRFFSQYLYSEYARRGTNMIFSYKGDKSPSGETLPIDGEFIRLIRGSKETELLYENIPLQNVGWCLGCSSPMYRGLNKYDIRLNKLGEDLDIDVDYTNIDCQTAETTFGAYDDVKYDCGGANSTATRRIDGGKADTTWTDIRGEKLSSFVVNGTMSPRNCNGKAGLRFTSNSTAGRVGFGRIDNTNADDKLFVADPLMDYEICFSVRVISGSGSLNFEIEGFDAQKNTLNDAFIMPNGDRTSNQFLSLPLSKFNPGHWYFVRGIVHCYSSEPKEQTLLNIGYGTNLYFNNSFLRYIFPKIYLNGVGMIDVYNYKIRPLVRGTNILPLRGKTHENCFSLGFIQSNRIFHAYFRNNNNSQSKAEITDIIERYLLPYDMTDILTFINNKD